VALFSWVNAVGGFPPGGGGWLVGGWVVGQLGEVSRDTCRMLTDQKTTKTDRMCSSN